MVGAEAGGVASVSRGQSQLGKMNSSRGGGSGGCLPNGVNALHTNKDYTFING